MPIQTVMFMTVGISLLENIKQRMNDADESIDSDLPAREIIPKYYHHCLCFKDLHLYPGLGEAIFPCAEIQSFCHWLKAQPKESVVLKEIVLLPTKTEPAPFCSEKIKNILTKQVFESEFAKKYLFKNDNVSVVDFTPFQLRLENNDNFAEDISKFLHDFKDNLEKYKKENCKVVLNITGGYKSLTPFFSLFGFLLEEIEVIYQHEESNVILRIPALPLAWDFKLFDEYRSLLRGGGELLSDPPAKFSILFDKKDEKWTKNPFGSLLEDIYTEDRLKRFGYGARLIRRLPKEMQEKLLPENSTGGIYQWEHIWMGDQIPETVEHSRGHSQRLMEYAASLLEPCFAQDSSFLEDHELYCLICCLWLHDIGHTSLRYYKPPAPISDFSIAPFPTLVRAYHNWLSNERIRYYTYLPEDEREAVALISLYHRGKMPLIGDMLGKKEWFDHKAKSLENRIPEGGLKFGSETISSERVLLLCALLKFIDSLDAQSDRVIDENYVNERWQRTKDEIKYYRRVLKQRREFTSWCDDVNHKAIDELIEKTEEIYEQWRRLKGKQTDWEQAKQISDMIENLVAPSVAKAVRHAIENQKSESCEREACLGVISVIDKLGFKMSTHHHFLKHSRIKLVYMTHGKKSEQEISYCIHMIFDSDYAMSIDQKKELAKEIWDEAEHVSVVLQEHGIFFEGVFDEDKTKPLLPA